MDKPILPISELVARADFPQGVVGEVVDIGGYIGTVVEVLHNSIRVRLPEGVTRGFNIYTLRKLYGPRPEPEMGPYPDAEATSPAPGAATKRTEEEPEPEADPELPNPDFNREPKPISLVVTQSGFPTTALGEMIDISGYVGVVVQVLNQSMKVRSREGTSRRYNAETLRKLHGTK
jgi:hypothetical protein